MTDVLGQTTFVNLYQVRKSRRMVWTCVLLGGIEFGLAIFDRCQREDLTMHKALIRKIPVDCFLT